MPSVNNETSTTTTTTTTTRTSRNDDDDDKKSLLLMDPKLMDGPVVKMTVADVFKGYPKTFMLYHVIGTTYDLFSPIGLGIGCILHGTGLYRPFPTIVQTMATSSLLAGCTGMAIGTIALANSARKGDTLQPIPWNNDGIQQRVDGLSNNFKVRVLDISVWSGIVAAAGVIAISGGSTSNISKYIKVSSGTLGLLQVLQLGAATGSILGIACITNQQRKTAKMLSE